MKGEDEEGFIKEVWGPVTSLPDPSLTEMVCLTALETLPQRGIYPIIDVENVRRWAPKIYADSAHIYSQWEAEGIKLYQARQERYKQILEARHRKGFHHG